MFQILTNPLRRRSILYESSSTHNSIPHLSIKIETSRKHRSQTSILFYSILFPTLSTSFEPSACINRKSRFSRETRNVPDTRPSKLFFLFSEYEIHAYGIRLGGGRKKRKGKKEKEEEGRRVIILSFPACNSRRCDRDGRCPEGRVPWTRGGATDSLKDN